MKAIEIPINFMIKVNKKKSPAQKIAEATLTIKMEKPRFIRFLLCLKTSIRIFFLSFEQLLGK